MFKVCSTCKVKKETSDFHKKNGYKFGVSSVCKKCCNEYNKASNKRPHNKKRISKYLRKWTKDNPEKRRSSEQKYKIKYPEKVKDKLRRKNLKINYGITLDEYTVMFEKQDGVCKICGGKKEGKLLCVDHNHITGKIRGLLCGNCNTGLGMLQDSVGLLRKAIKYLK